jgi:hypothetical protein
LPGPDGFHLVIGVDIFPGLEGGWTGTAFLDCMDLTPLLVVGTLGPVWDKVNKWILSTDITFAAVLGETTKCPVCASYSSSIRAGA